MRFDLSDDEWALLEPLMPKSRKSARADDRIMNAIFYVLRTGMPWRDLPERYGPYTRSNATRKAYCPKRFYRQRHKIENYFCRIKDWRRIATRYDKLARNFLAAPTWWDHSIGSGCESRP